jgi:hypothetical protein
MKAFSSYTSYVKEKHGSVNLRKELKVLKQEFYPVLRIRDVYSGSRIRIFYIPDPRSASKN